jgi:hypothetical protein
MEASTGGGSSLASIPPARSKSVGLKVRKNNFAVAALAHALLCPLPRQFQKRMLKCGREGGDVSVRL